MADSGKRRLGAVGYSADVLGFSPTVFVLLRDLIASRTGVFFADDKRDQLADKLTDLLDAQSMSSYLDYYYLLRYDADAERHWAQLSDRLAVPETFFWRQEEHFRVLAEIIAPAHFARRPGVPLRIWSAACCSGEEPVSMAIALAEAGLLGRQPIQIVATDASAALVERARRGIYGERSFRNLPRPLRDRYFRQLENGTWAVDRRVHSEITYGVANLVDAADVRRLAVADVIFCRNVFIYFSDETIGRVASQFHDGLADDGHLFLGASESLTRMETGFELDEVGRAFVYVKESRSRHGRDSRADDGARTLPRDG
ncbi:MAG: protein-glutamate O-methyltransferase CheR [Gemmatimonadaceae bacterium]